MTALTLPTGAFVRTYPKPTGTFHALAVDEASMRKYGLPPRPINDKLANHWESVVRYLKNQYIVPRFAIHEDRFHGPRKTPGIALPATHDSPLTTHHSLTLHSTNWCGSLVVAPAEKPIRWVYAGWTIPRDFQPAARDQGNSCCAFCLGIDGVGSADALQVGVTCELRGSGDKAAPTVYLWWEWFPEVEVAVENFPVHPGDLVNVTICASPDRDDRASICVANQSAGVCTSFEVNAPKGTTLSGNCAEWIVDRPSIAGTLPPLPRFKGVDFGHAIAGVARERPEEILDAAKGSHIDMVDEGTTLCSTRLTNAEQVRILASR